MTTYTIKVDSAEEMQDILDAPKMASAIDDAKQILRNYRKHIDMDESQCEMFERLDTELLEALYIGRD